MELAIRIIIWFTYLISLYFLIFWLVFYFNKRAELKEELKIKPVIKDYPLVSVIIPAFNEEKTIEKTLRSVINLEYPKDKLEIIAVNDGSSDRTADIVSSFIKKNPSFDIKLINQPNGGKASALNNALSKLKGKYFSCLDADSFVESKALKNMISMLVKDKDLSLVTPVMKVYKPKTLIQKFQRLEYMTAMLIIKLMGYIDCNYVAPGPFSVYKTALIRKLGGFDKTSLVEDQEIAYRIQKGHYKIRQCAKAFVYTVAPKNLKELGKQRNRWFKGTFLNLFYYRSLFFNKKYGDFGFFQMPATLVVYIFAFSVLISFFYYLVRPIFLKLYDLYLVGFDFMPYIQNLKFTFNILDVDLASFFIIYLMLGAIFVVMYFSSRMAKDSVTKCGKIHLVPYFFIYFLILAFMAIKVMFEVAIGKKQKW